MWGYGRAFPSTATTNISDISSTGTSLIFESGTTQTLGNFTVTGNVGGANATLTSTVPGTQFNLRKTTGTVNTNYLIVQDSNVSAAFFANVNSTDAGNNVGWNFTTPSVVQGNFSNFF
jgi:hypothetical protein